MESKTEQSPSSSQMQARCLSHLKISDILDLDTLEILDGHYIDVRVLWTSGIIESKFQNGSVSHECHFILSDDSNHLAAKLTLKGDSDLNGLNICRLLQPERHVRILGFLVTSVPYDPLSIENNYNILKKQRKRIQLSHSSKDIFSVATTTSGPATRSYLSYIPFDFIEFMEMDHVNEDSSVDLIGYVIKVDNNMKERDDGRVLSYQKLGVRSAQSDKTCFFRSIALFDGHINRVESDGVYAFSNLKVGHFRGNVSLKATFRSVIIKITPENLTRIIPPKYQQSKLLEDLFPKEHLGHQSETQETEIIEIPISQDMPSIAKKPRLEIENGNGERSCDTGEQVCEYDFTETAKPLKVEVKHSKEFMDTGEDAYSMRSKPRGVALIIFNSVFPMRNPSSPEKIDRKGGVHDARYLRDFLQQCGNFYVDIKHNVTSDNLQGVIDEFKKDVVEQYEAGDACVIAVFSHGSFGQVEMVDGNHVNLHDAIIYQFDELSFPIMKGKPKIFILQTCQSFSENVPIQPSKQSHQRNAGGLKNMIVCYPASPGSTATRDKFMGSHFIYVLVDIFMKNARDKDFVTMMDMVHEGLQKIVHDGSERLTCTYNHYGFNKKLYFNPGL